MSSITERMQQANLTKKERTIIETVSYTHLTLPTTSRV